MRSTSFSGEMVEHCHHPHCWTDCFGNGKNTKEPSAMAPKDELDDLKKDLRIVKEENLKLQAVITDVTEVNKRWQKYNNDRQMYVEKLLSTIQDQQEQMNKNIEKRLLMTKESGEGMDTVGQLLGENARLKDENAQLKRQMEVMEREHKEHVEVLEIQVKANKDDWEAEKREKELATQEKERLEAKIESLQEELNLYKLQLREGKSTSDRLNISQRRNCCCGNSVDCHNGRDGHCSSSHITICRKNSFPTFRTSVHMPYNPHHLIPRGSSIYLGDDLVIDGDSSSSSKPPIASSGANQHELQSPPSNESSLQVPSPDDKPHEVEMKVEATTEREDKQETIEATSGVGVISSVVAVPQSRSASSFSSASSLSLASVSSSRLKRLNPIKKESATSAGNLASSSSTSLSSALFPNPLPTSYSDTVVPNHKSSVDFRGSQRSSSSNLKVNIEASVVAKDNHQLLTYNVLPNVTGDEEVEGYSEGILTQTRQDVICPGCGKVFHPEIHLQFLKHFGECQSKSKANKSENSFKTRN